MAPSAAYFDQPVGFWGQPTSTIDWCERNYEVTRFIAEFWNSVSNLFFIIPPLAVCIKLWSRKVERVYLLALVYMAFTGIGSFAFHATLKYEMQLWDELSMVWSATFILYLLLKMHFPSKADGYVLPLIGYGLFMCTVYLFLKTPVIFQVSYAVLHYSVLIYAYKLIKTHRCDSRLYYGTLIAHHLAFLLWNIDNNFCGALERLRSALPPSCAPFTQLHAVWHFLAGYGSFALVLFCIQTRLLANKREYYVSLDQWSGLTLEETCVTNMTDSDAVGINEGKPLTNGNNCDVGSSNSYEFVFSKQK